jgi:hypothetical protein
MEVEEATNIRRSIKEVGSLNLEINWRPAVAARCIDLLNNQDIDLSCRLDVSDRTRDAEDNEQDVAELCVTSYRGRVADTGCLRMAP